MQLSALQNPDPISWNHTNDCQWYRLWTYTHRL